MTAPLSPDTETLRRVLLDHHPLVRSETGPLSGCRCGQVKLGQDVIAHVAAQVIAAYTSPAEEAAKLAPHLDRLERFVAEWDEGERDYFFVAEDITDLLRWWVPALRAALADGDEAPTQCGLDKCPHYHAAIAATIAGERARAALASPAPAPQGDPCPECNGSLMARCGLPCDVCERTGTAEEHARFREKAAR